MVIEGNRNKKSDAMILIGVLIIFGLVFGGFGVYKYNIGKQSSDWPSETGKITYSHMNSKQVDGKTEYQASVKYSYTVDGTEYKGDQVTSSDVYFKSMLSANEVVDRYPTGSEVSVHYNPDKPNTAVLETGIKKNVYLLIGGGLVCFLLAIAILVSSLKKK